MAGYHFEDASRGRLTHPARVQSPSRVAHLGGWAKTIPAPCKGPQTRVQLLQVTL
jgi:hypothetical protein